MPTGHQFGVIALLTLGAAGCSPKAAPSTNQTTGDVSTPEVRHEEARPPSLDVASLGRLVVAGINAERQRAGLPPMVHDDRLGAMADAHSADIVANDFFDHVNPGGETVGARAQAHGVTCRVGENLFQTYRFSSYRTEYDGERLDVYYNWYTEVEMAEAAVRAWMESPLHRMVLLRPEFTRMGLGITQSSDLRLFITQDAC